MNAPRRGVFATLLAISFLLHILLMVQNALHYQSVARDSQGALFLEQMSEDVTVSLANHDTVSLALLAGRYGESQNISSIQIFDEKNTLLAQGGSAYTRLGKTFTQNIVIDNKPIGKINVTLFKLNPGEVFRTQWLYFLGSLLIHVLLWILYGRVARPEKHLLDLYLINAQEEVFHSEPAHPHSTGIHLDTHETPFAQGAVFEPTSDLPVHDITTIHAKHQYKTVLCLQFFDRNNLLDALSSGMAAPYYQLNQTIIEKAVQALLDLNPAGSTFVKAQVLRPIQASGALIGIDGRTLDVLEFGIALGLLLNMLTESVYSHHKANNLFALHTHAAVAESTDNSLLPQSLAVSLLKQLDAGSVAIHCQSQFMEPLKKKFSFYQLPDLPTTKDCHALVINSIVDEGVRKTLSLAQQRVLAAQ